MHALICISSASRHHTRMQTLEPRGQVEVYSLLTRLFSANRRRTKIGSGDRLVVGNG